MIHARRDYDRIQDPDSKIPLDEPVFLIRGQDPIGWLTVAYWLGQHTGVGTEAVHRGMGSPTHETLTRALWVHIEKMRKWSEQANHGPATVSDDQLRLW